MKNIKGIFAKQLKTIREARNMTQNDLAKASGMHQTAISHFESGRRVPVLNNLHCLAQALGVSMDYLVGRDQDSIDRKEAKFKIFNELKKELFENG